MAEEELDQLAVHEALTSEPQVALLTENAEVAVVVVVVGVEAVGFAVRHADAMADVPTAYARAARLANRALGAVALQNTFTLAELEPVTLAHLADWLARLTLWYAVDEGATVSTPAAILRAAVCTDDLESSRTADIQEVARNVLAALFGFEIRPDGKLFRRYNAAAPFALGYHTTTCFRSHHAFRSSTNALTCSGVAISTKLRSVTRTPV